VRVKRRPYETVRPDRGDQDSKRKYKPMGSVLLRLYGFSHTKAFWRQRSLSTLLQQTLWPYKGRGRGLRYCPVADLVDFVRDGRPNL